MLIAIEDSVITPLELMSDEVDLLPMARMERVRDAHGYSHRLGAGCS